METDTYDYNLRRVIARQLHWHGYNAGARAIMASSLRVTCEDGVSHVRIVCHDYYVPLLRSLTWTCAWAGKGPGPLDAAFDKIVPHGGSLFEFHFEVIEGWQKRAA